MTTVDAGNGTRKQFTADDIQKNADTSTWFDQKIEIPSGGRELLEGYAKLKPDEIVPHVAALRQRAFDVWPYPCIGQLSFLQLIASTHPHYSTVLERLAQGQTYLDAGCCFGQDIRKLLHDGAPSSAALYGTDIEPAFFELGKELFRDRETIKSKFFAADLTKPTVTDPTYQQIRGGIDIVSVQNVFHLFGMEDQRALAKHLVALSRPVPGSIIIGRQVGSRVGGNYPSLTPDMVVYAHSPATWQLFWDEIGQATGSKWKVDVFTEDVPERLSKQKWANPDFCVIMFTITRL